MNKKRCVLVEILNNFSEKFGYKSFYFGMYFALFIWDDDTVHIKTLKIEQKTCKEIGAKEEYTLVERTA